MLALLLERPRTPGDWARWSLHHKSSHNLIRSAIFKQDKASLPDYLIDPIFLIDPRQWLQSNQQLHSDMNSTLHLPSSDIQDVDFNDDHAMQAWVYLHWAEHNAAEGALKVGS